MYENKVILTTQKDMVQIKLHITSVNKASRVLQLLNSA